MSKFLFCLLLSISAAGLFSSCRKGADDPFMSFRSRAQRLEGRWQIVEGREEYNNINSSNTSIMSITDSVYSKNTTGGSTFNESGVIKMEYTFTKDGHYTLTRTETFNEKINTLSTSGTWTFLGKSGDLKNKEAILLTELSRTFSFYGMNQVDSFAVSNQGVVWRISCLKDDYLAIDSEVEHAWPNPYSEKIHYEFKQD